LTGTVFSSLRIYYIINFEQSCLSLDHNDLSVAFEAITRAYMRPYA